MRWERHDAGVLLFFLFFFSVSSSPVEPDQVFLFDDGGRRHTLCVFSGSMRHRQPLHIDYGTSGAGQGSLAMVARGRHRWLKFLSNDATRLSLQLGPGNPVWARWRYALLTNLSLRLTNTAVTTQAGARLQCVSNASRGLCVTNVSRILDAANHSHILGHHRVIVDPDRAVSSLPPDLYFLLTNGRARWHKAGITTSGDRFDLSTALRIDCVVVADQGGLRICERDMPWFELGGIRVPAERDAIVLGSAYWVTNTTRVVMDGWTSEMVFLFPPTMSLALVAATSASSPNASALLWCCFAIALGCIIGLYSRWINFPATPNVGMILLRIWHHPHAQKWEQDYRMTLNLIGLVAAGCGTGLVVALSYSYLPSTMGDGPYWQVLILGLFIYGVVQTLLAVLIAFGARTHIIPGEVPRRRACLAASTTTIPVAWARHLTQGTGALAFTCAALVPLAYDGSVSASMVLLFIPLAVALALLYHHTYYAIVLTALVASEVRGLQHGQRVPFALLAVFELLLLGGLAAVLVVFYLAPVVDATSPFFAVSWNYLLAVIVMVLVMAGAAIWIMGEVRLALVKRDKKTV